MIPGRMSAWRSEAREVLRLASHLTSVDDEQLNLRQSNEMSSMGMMLSVMANKKRRSIRTWNAQQRRQIFVVMVEAIRRSTGLTLHEEQIMAARALSEGMIAQALTGEGKTLTAMCAAGLFACTGKSVHVVTVNDYLAQRDSEQAADIFSRVGLSVGCIQSDTSAVVRRQEYDKDIVYISNTELGFDYLRDNLAQSLLDQTQQGRHDFVIVDEIDSVLIDDARTPLIIAGAGEDKSALFKRMWALVSGLEEGSEDRKFNRAEAYLGIERKEEGDLIFHKRENNVVLTVAGHEKVKAAFGEDFFDSPERIFERNVLNMCMKARMMERDVDYVVMGGQIVIVDKSTGRAQPGRHFSDGLHQAIEAKEGVEITSVSTTVASVTYQNFFRKYAHLCGMTGTAWEEREEFWGTYRLKVAKIPTHAPCIRVDEPDRLYMTKEDKWAAVVKEVIAAHDAGQPVLVGTASVEDSEHVSKLLEQAQITHEVLNAKQDEAEAQQIAKAGIAYAVTVATDMAGRGTDIKLTDEAREAGGLLVIGTERHESRRVDNQLRGRSGRQGDPGRSVFFCSFEDRVVRLWGGDRVKKLVGSAVADGDAVVVKSAMRMFNTAQVKAVSDAWSQRRNTLEYDNVGDVQRERIYAERQSILRKDEVSDHLESFIQAQARRLYARAKGDREELSRLLKAYTQVDITFDTEDVDVEQVVARVMAEYERVKTESQDFERDARRAILVAIDSAWSEHLRSLEYARECSIYSGFVQKDAKSVYAHEAWRLYDEMLINIRAAAMLVFFTHAFKQLNMETESGEKMRTVSAKRMEV